MTMCRLKRLFGMSIVVALALAPSAAPAQLEMLGAAMMSGDQPVQTVAGTGMATVSRQPGRIRMHIVLKASGATLEEALAQLKSRREAAVAKLEALKADQASIKTGAPTVAEGQSEQRRRMEQMIIPQLRARGQQIPPGLMAPQLASVSTTLTAEWPLEAATPEDVLLRTEAIRTQIKEANLSGSGAEEELSPEAQELAEEMAGMGYDDDSPVPEGEPLFLYVAHLSEADREKVTAEAFAKARDQASSFARAAGTDLGPLVSLAGHGSGESDTMDRYRDYEQQRYIRQLIGSSGGMSLDQKADELVSTSPGDLSYKIMVRAIFALAPPK